MWSIDPRLMNKSSASIVPPAPGMMFKTSPYELYFEGNARIEVGEEVCDEATRIVG